MYTQMLARKVVEKNFYMIDIFFILHVQSVYICVFFGIYNSLCSLNLVAKKDYLDNMKQRGVV
jgi:hypothetical protein